MPATPKKPYAALMQPMVIVPELATDKPVIADAGSIIKLADQRTLYRDRVSPVTRKADEILVHYGNPKKPMLGWITQRLGAKVMKPSKGPTFLVTTKVEVGIDDWELLRFKMAQARMKDPTMWIAPWLATHGPKHPSALRQVTRLFGGKPVKNEDVQTRVERLFTLILHTEIDMKSVKKHKKGKSTKAKVSEKESKKSSKASAKAKAAKLGDSSRLTKKQDDYVIKRLVKENPRRAGSAKAKLWDKLKKGMTVGEFIAKGGSRASVARYVENGWVKLLKPASE